MENGHVSTVFTIVIQQNGLLLTSTTTHLFVFFGHMPYAIFAEAEDIWGLFIVKQLHFTCLIGFGGDSGGDIQKLIVSHPW